MRPGCCYRLWLSQFAKRFCLGRSKIELEDENDYGDEKDKRSKRTRGALRKLAHHSDDADQSDRIVNDDIRVRSGQLFSCLTIVLIVGPKLFIEPGTKAFFRLSSVSGPGL